MKNVGELKTLEELLNKIDDRKWDIKLRIISLYTRIKRNIRTVIYTPKWWVQRAKRGYNDRDMWNADVYLAGVIAGTLQWYIDKGHGVSMSYASEDDPCGIDIDNMVKNRNKDYKYAITLFEEYNKNGHAFNEEWKKEFGGLVDEEVEYALQWFAKHFTELWD